MEGSVGGVTVVTRISRKGAALISRVLHRDNAFHAGRIISRHIVSDGSLRERENVAVLSGGATVRCGGAGVGVISAPKRTSFKNRIRQVLAVISNILLLISTFRNYVPRAEFILGGTLNLRGAPVIIVGGVSESNTHPGRIVSRILSLFVRLNTSSSRVRFPIVCTSNESNCTDLSPSTERNSVEPLFSTVLGCVPSPTKSPRNPTRVLFSSLRCSSCINEVNINEVAEKALGGGSPCILYGRSNHRRGVHVAGLCRFRKLGEIPYSRTVFNSVIYITNVPSLGVNRATYSPSYIRTLPFIGVSRPAVDVGFVMGSSPFTNERNGCIADHGVHRQLFGRIRAGISVQIRRASSVSAFGISKHNRLRLSVLVRAVHHRGCRFRISHPRIVLGGSTRAKRALRPVRLTVVRIPRRCINTIVRGLYSHGNRIRGVSAHSAKVARLRVGVPSENLVNCEDRFLASAGKGNVVGRLFTNCRPFGNSVTAEAHNSVVTRRANISANCNL